MFGSLDVSFSSKLLLVIRPTFHSDLDNFFFKRITRSSLIACKRMRSSDSTVYDRLDVVTKKNYHSFCVGGTLLLCFHSEFIQSCLEDGLELSLKKSLNWFFIYVILVTWLLLLIVASVHALYMVYLKQCNLKLLHNVLKKKE